MRRCYQNPKNANCDSCWLRFPWREWNGGQEDCGLGKLVINCSTHTNTHTHSLFGQSTDRWNVAIDGRTSRTGHFNLVCQRQTLTAECSSSCSQNWFAQRHLKPPRPVPSSPFLPQHRQMHRQRESERGLAICEWKDTLLISNFTLCCVKINTVPTFNISHLTFAGASNQLRLRIPLGSDFAISNRNRSP